MFSPATQFACCRNVSGVADAAGASPAVAGGVVAVPAPPFMDGVAVADAAGEAVADAAAEADAEADAGGDAGWR